MKKIDIGLKLYNTKTQKKEPFTPLDDQKIGMYICGPTIYRDIHVGNARPTIVFDLLFRVLRLFYRKENVTYVRNFTDVDDKIIAEANKIGITANELTEKIMKSFHEDMSALKNLSPTIEPKATEHIQEMIEMIEKLVEKGFAYESNGHIFFDVSKFSKYGELSKIQQDEIIHGARIDISTIKRNAADFVLWKPTDNEPRWESPWSIGRPGWHIECSAMGIKYLGNQFDISGGGHDLLFPHHENSNAQSCCATGCSNFANIWMHNGLINVDSVKMSKSLNNIVILKDAIAEYSAPVIRYFILSTHYRKDMIWSDNGLKSATQSMLKLSKACQNFQENSLHNDENSHECDAVVLNALRDDLNTPLAIARLHQLASIANGNDQNNMDYINSEIARDMLKKSMNFLGILCNIDEIKLHTSNGEKKISEEEIEMKITERNDARKKKNFLLADEIRNELLEKGVRLEDSGERTKWEII